MKENVHNSIALSTIQFSNYWLRKMSLITSLWNLWHRLCCHYIILYIRTKFRLKMSMNISIYELGNRNISMRHDASHSIFVYGIRSLSFFKSSKYFLLTQIPLHAILIINWKIFPCHKLQMFCHNSYACHYCVTCYYWNNLIKCIHSPQNSHICWIKSISFCTIY